MSTYEIALSESYNAQGNLDLDVILQGFVVQCLSGQIEPEFVRPAWQPVETGYPDIGVNWVSIGVRHVEPDVTSQNVQVDENTIAVHRHETITFMASFFGEGGYTLATLLREACTLWQNRVILQNNGIEIKEVKELVRLPELVNQQWQNRVDFTLLLRRHSIRLYESKALASMGSLTLRSAVNGN